WMRRSARVDLPWSIWAMIEKLRVSSIMAPEKAKTRRFRRVLAFQRKRASGRRRPDRDELGAVAAPDQEHVVALAIDPGDQLVELRGAGDLLVVQAEDDVARPDTHRLGWPGDALHQRATLDVQPGALLG